MDSSVSGRSNRLAWGLIAAILVIDLAWLSSSTITVVPFSLGLPVLAGLAMLIIAGIYRARRGEPRLADAFDTVGQMIAFMAVAALLSYLMASLAFPMQDRALYAIDRELGLDWLAFLKAVDARPWLGTLFSFAYLSFIPQVLILLLALSFSGQGRIARTTLLAMMLSGLVTIVVSGFVPAMAMFVHLGLTPADYPNLAPSAAFVHVVDFEALRSGKPVLIDLARAEGIITFPSYHAALGLIMLLAALSHPWLRWPFGLLNLAMIAATPIDGGHYFIDVIAGLVIAALSYLAARHILADRPVSDAAEPVASHGKLVTDH